MEKLTFQEKYKVIGIKDSSYEGIIIPRHRVIGYDGSLTGYGSGLHREKWLLDSEKRNSLI